MRDEAVDKETLTADAQAAADPADHQDPEERVDAQTNTEAEASDPAEASDQTERSEAEPDKASDTRYLRLLADFDNYKRRTQREKAEIYQYANESLIKDLLPVLDAFDMALQTAPAEDDETHKSVMTGLEQIQRQLLSVLEGAGLSRIAGAGESYDPVYHEAIMVVDDAEAPANTIIDELRAGYQFKDKVLRPTVCRVSGNS